MSKKKDFNTMLLEADLPIKRSKRAPKPKNDKTSSPIAVIDSSIDVIECDEEVCVVEVPISNDLLNTSDSIIIEMSAAEKLKSQAKTSTPNATSKTSKKKKARRDSNTSSEEERWLDAIESGKLEQVDDELKKIKDPKLMTARQRAIYERSMDKDQVPGNDSLLSLPTGYKEKVMTAEAIQKAALKSQKRKQMADEKREKDKKKTMDRLLKKQDTKTNKINKNKLVKVFVPVISYRDTIDDGATLSFPVDAEVPLKEQKSIDPPKPTLCVVCKDIKRYNCSKTNAPLCSLNCYKINLEIKI